jgi:hypothetical protein
MTFGAKLLSLRAIEVDIYQCDYLLMVYSLPIIVVCKASATKEMRQIKKLFVILSRIFRLLTKMRALAEYWDLSGSVPWVWPLPSESSWCVGILRD